MTMDDSAFVTSNGNSLRDKLEFISLAQDNFGICPLKAGESVTQLTTSLTGLDANVELFYLLVASKTDIPYTELMGKSAQGMDATGAGDRRKWYDKCRSIQSENKDNILTAYGICAGLINGDGRFVKFPDYIFNPLEEATEKERAENIRSYSEVATKLIELGAKTEDVFKWLKTFKDFHLDNINLDDLAPSLEDYTDDTVDITAELLQKVANEWNESKHPRAKDGKFGPGSSNPTTANTIEISGSEIGSFDGDVKAYIKKAHDWYRQNYQNKVVSTPELGDVHFYGRGFWEVKDKNFKNVENLRYLPAVEQILKNSTDVTKEEPKHKRDDDIVAF